MEEGKHDANDKDQNWRCREPANVPTDRVGRAAWTDSVQSTTFGGPRGQPTGEQPASAGSDSPLSGWRAVHDRYVGHETGGASGDPRRIPTSGDCRTRRADLRALAEAGTSHGLRDAGALAVPCDRRPYRRFAL